MNRDDIYVPNYKKIIDLFNKIKEIKENLGDDAIVEHDHFSDEINFYSLEKWLEVNKDRLKQRYKNLENYKNKEYYTESHKEKTIEEEQRNIDGLKEYINQIEKEIADKGI